MDRLDYGLLRFVLDLIDISKLVASLSGPTARTGRKPYDARTHSSCAGSVPLPG